jgi:signal transduction histidine kinase
VSTPRRRADIVRWLRRFMPQRVRTRLTLLYAALFLAGGTILLGLSFALVSSSLPVKAPQFKATSALLAQCKQEANIKQQATALNHGKSSFKGSVTTLTKACEKTFQSGLEQAALDQRNRTLSNLHTYSIAGLLGLVVVSAGLGWVISGRVLRPVRRITETARRASEEHLGERLHLGGPKDELRELADTFDAMLDRLDLAFASQRQFVANASHELRTPLTVMRTSIDVTLAKPNRSPAQLEAMAERVRTAVDRAEQTIEALLTLASSGDESAMVADDVDLVVAVEDALDDVAPLASERGLTIDRDLEPSLTKGNRVLIERLVGNLIQNAVRYNVERGWVRVHTHVANGQVVLSVENSGPRVTDEALPGLCDPFQRGAGRIGEGGVGLGLSIVRSVSEAHHGSLQLVNPQKGGLAVTVTLPSANGAAELSL